MEYKIGDRNGCIEVTSHPFKKVGKINYYSVKCDCGNCFVMQQGNFKKSLGKYCIKCRSKAQTFYTKETRRLRHIWCHIKVRCYDKRNRAYCFYGQKGVFLCDEWLNSFESFRDWALANGYDNSLTIDRIDSNGSYEPSNCRWANWVEQARNRSNNVFYDFEGERIIQVELLQRYNINCQTFLSRIKKGMTLKEALTTPVVKQNKKPRITTK